MAAPDPAATERQMYVDMHLNGVDDLSLSLAELRDIGGGGVNAWKAAETTGVGGGLNGKVSKSDLPINVKDFGAVGDGVSDDTAAIQEAIDYLEDVPIFGGGLAGSGDYQNKPSLYFPHGKYRVTAGFFVSFSGLSIVGDGSLSSGIFVDTNADIVIFDIGVFTTTPTSLYSNPGAVQGASIRGLTIQRDMAPYTDPPVAGARLGQGIRASGGGGLTLDDVRVHGFAYGINCPWGADFNLYSNVWVGFCDVGVYQGPAGQQFETSHLAIENCIEGLVLDRASHVYMSKPAIMDCSLACIVIEAMAGGTRQITFPEEQSWGAINSQIVFDTPWFESNAGAQQDTIRYIPDHFIEFRTGTFIDAHRDVTFRNPYIIAGDNPLKTTTSFIAHVSGATPPQRIKVLNPVLGGTMTQWFTNPGAFWDLVDPWVQSGYTAPTNANTGVGWERTTRGRRIAGALPISQSFENESGTQGTRSRYYDYGIVQYSFYHPSQPSVWLHRLGLDVQNSRFVFGDPTLNTAPCLGAVPAMPTAGAFVKGSFILNTNPVVSAGKTLLGWQRLTTGSDHVNGTDWTPVYGTTT